MEKKLLLSAVLIFLAAGLFANEDFSFHAGINFGPNNTIINEALYNKKGKDRKISSLLIWESYGLPSFEAELGFKFFNRLHTNLSANYVIPASSGKLRDYDWMNLFSTGDSKLTHYSKHENSLDNYIQTDFSLGYSFNPWPGFTLLPFLSFKYSYLSFTANEGYRQYGAKIGQENGYDVYESW
jgi:outer membrane protease